MRRFLLGINLLLFASFTGISGDLVFPAYLIPDTLLSDANAVIRNLESVLTIQSDNSASYTIRKAVTILNEKGEDHGNFYAFYDNQRKLSGISIKIYNAFGKIIEKVKSEEIRDYSAASGFSLYEDSRVMVYEPVIKTYPYTVVTEVLLNYKGYIQFPVWQPQKSPDLSVEKATFTIRMQGGHEVRWHQSNVNFDPHISTTGNTKVVHWVLNDLAAFERVVFQPPMDEITPNVKVAPTDFTYDGHKGSLDTWKGFGDWINKLILDRDVLNEETVIKMQSLVADTQDTIEIIRRIYKYVQEHTRYVSIQYGIGGFQPFEAQVVDKVGYGDCKALTNYTKALLGCVGINSVYTVVNAGKYADEIITDFSSQQFNHAILFVPLNNDTIWLECTDQNMPFGYLGKFTSDRRALAITDAGGSFVSTKSCNESPGLTSCYGEVDIDENGNGQASLNFSYSGLNYDDVFSFIHWDKESQEKWLYNHYYIPNAEIEKYAIENNPDLIPSAEIIIDLKLEKYAGKSGKRLFIPLNKLDALNSTPPNKDNRKFDIYIRNAFMESDSVVFSIPDGYSVEHLPDEVEIYTCYGSYFISTVVTGQKVKYCRKLKICKGRFPANGYTELYDFYKSIVKYDKAKLVLIADN